MRSSMKRRQRVNRACGVVRLSKANACRRWQGVLMIRRPLGSPCGCAGMMAACGACRSAAPRRCGIAVGSRPCRSDGFWSVIQTPSINFSTCPSDQAGSIVRCFIKRWSIETTFEESRAHLGFETQRQWSDLAIERMTPCLLGLYSLVTLLADALYLEGRLAVRQSAGMPRSRRRSATLWQRCGNICGRSSIFQHRHPTATGWKFLGSIYTA